MLIAALIALAILQLVAIGILLARKPAGSETDPRLAQLPEQLTSLVSEEARRTREDSAASSANLRTEVVSSMATLGRGLKEDLKAFREDNANSATALRGDVEQKMRTLSQGFTDFKNETATKHRALEESLNSKLVSLMESNSGQQEKLRSTVEERLNKLNTDNTAKLEEMRATVDEKLHTTLQTRLTESFGQVTTHLGEVQKGLGEMKEMATNINDLNRVFSNVTRRGDIGEAILGDLIREILAPTQFKQSVRVNPATTQEVEFAVRLPSATGETLLPIDSKFPREDWLRLQDALESGNGDRIRESGKKFESAIRIQAKLISDKYINEPITTPYAIMFLPTEGLYAEVIRRDGLQQAIQKDFCITIAGPSTLSAILISFKMGFRLLNLQQKGNDVWKVLTQTRTEFGKFEKLMDSAEKQIGTVQNTMHNLGVRSRAINRALDDAADMAPQKENVLSFDGIAPRLAAGGEEF